MANITPLRRKAGTGLQPIRNLGTGAEPMPFIEQGQQLPLSFSSAVPRANIAVASAASEVGFRRLAREQSVHRQTSAKELALEIQALENHNVAEMDKLRGDPNNVDIYSEYQSTPFSDPLVFDQLHTKYDWLGPQVVDSALKLSEFRLSAHAKKRKTAMIVDNAKVAAQGERAKFMDQITADISEDGLGEVVKGLQGVNDGLYDIGVYDQDTLFTQNVTDVQTALARYVTRKREAILDDPESNVTEIEQLKDALIAGAGWLSNLSEDKRWREVGLLTTGKNDRIKAEEEEAEKISQMKADIFFDLHNDHPEELTTAKLVNAIETGVLIGGAEGYGRDGLKIAQLTRILTHDKPSKSSSVVLEQLGDMLSLGMDMNDQTVVGRMFPDVDITINPDDKGSDVVERFFIDHLDELNDEGQKSIRAGLIQLRTRERQEIGKPLTQAKTNARKKFKSVLFGQDDGPIDYSKLSRAVAGFSVTDQAGSQLYEILATATGLINDAKTPKEANELADRFIGQYMEGQGEEKRKLVFRELGPQVIQKYADGELLTLGETSLLEYIRRLNKKHSTSDVVWRGPVPDFVKPDGNNEARAVIDNGGEVPVVAGEFTASFHFGMSTSLARDVEAYETGEQVRQAIKRAAPPAEVIVPRKKPEVDEPEAMGSPVMRGAVIDNGGEVPVIEGATPNEEALFSPYLESAQQEAYNAVLNSYEDRILEHPQMDAILVELEKLENAAKKVLEDSVPSQKDVEALLAKYGIKSFRE